MKRFVWIGILILFVFAACDTTTREARRMVKRAERLADTLPDSTVRLIDSVLRMPANFSERERMDMALLQAEALFGCRDVSRNVSKNDDGFLGDVSGNVSTISPIMDDDFFDDHDQISTSPELERASAYYARKKQYDKAAHAALYSGFVQQHYNEKESAMRSFKEAEQYGMLATDSLTVAQAEYWVGKNLIDDGIEQEAMNLLMSSASYIGNRYVDLATIENSKAVAYIVMGQNDSAELCLRQSLMYVEKGYSDKVKRKVWNNFAVLYRIQGKYENALDCLCRMLDDSNLNENGIFMSNLNLAQVFLDMKEMDSATKYFQRLETILPTVNVKKGTMATAYDALSRFAAYQDDTSLALQYREKHERVLCDLLMQRQEQIIYRTQRQYDYESLQNEMNRKIISRHLIILVISILLLVTTIIVLALQYRQKQMLKSEKEMKRQMDALKQDLMQTVKTSVLDHEISSRLRMILSAYDKSKQAKDPQKEWQPLVMKIMNGEDNPFDAARSVLETAYPHLYSTIQKNYPELSETETKICLLSCSDLSNAEIADFLGLRINTVNQSRSNLRKKLNLKSDRMKEQLRMALFK